MKKSSLRNLGVMAVVLCLVTTCLLGGTLAKYTSTITGTGTGTVAKWNFKANNSDGTTTVNIDLADTLTGGTNIAAKRMAPGTDGQFDIRINATGSEVGIDYTIAFSDLSNIPTGLKFYSDAGFSTEITDLATYNGFNGSIALADVNTEVTKTIYWQWAMDGNESDDVAKGTAGGADGTKIGFNVTITGTQADPTATPAS